MIINRVLIEGPDCSGKSTAVDRIKNALRWDAKSLHHRGVDQFERYVREYSLNENTVLDRGHFSEAVYGELWRGGNPFSEEEMKMLNFFAQRKSVIVFVCPALETMKQRYGQRNFQQQISSSELESSRNLFQKYLKEVNVIPYESSSYQELDELVAKIKALAGGK